MQVKLTCDNHFTANEQLTRQVEASVEVALDRFAEQLTSVQVHLSDENSHKGGGNDKKCVIEARPRGHQPLAATHHAATLDDALDGALERLEHVLDHTFGRLHQHKGRTSMGGDQTV
jgi:ribosome-associated translation inhibitor RaiA